MSVQLQGPWEAGRLKMEIKDETQDHHLVAEQRIVSIERKVSIYEGESVDK